MLAELGCTQLEEPALTQLQDDSFQDKVQNLEEENIEKNIFIQDKEIKNKSSKDPLSVKLMESFMNMRVTNIF